jgi:hypothetical protein
LNFLLQLATSGNSPEDLGDLAAAPRKKFVRARATGDLHPPLPSGSANPVNLQFCYSSNSGLSNICKEYASNYFTFCKYTTFCKMFIMYNYKDHVAGVKTLISGILQRMLSKSSPGRQSNPNIQHLFSHAYSRPTRRCLLIIIAF